jgi:methyl-accepting chemotaxis protein
MLSGFDARNDFLRPDERPLAPGLGLRLRIWLGCLAGALVAAAGLWLAIAYFAAATGAPAANGEFLRVWLPVIGTAGILVGLAMALWLDHGIGGALRGYLAALRSGQAADLRDLPAASGWGELSSLGEETQHTIARLQQTSRAFEELSRLQKQLEHARAALERWNVEERWEPLQATSGSFTVVARLMSEGLARHEEVREQNREAADQIRADLDRSLDDARMSAEETERGFVEATSLLTTVRELQRLSLDLGLAGSADASPPAEDPQAAHEPLRAAAARALGELAQASGESVQHLSSGLLRVREIADHVQILGNRATLMALNVMVARSRPGAAEQDLEELKSLAAEVRRATDRASALTREVEVDVERASQRMVGVRERVAEAMERIPAAAPAPAPRAAASRTSADLAHVLERVREMIQDATAKGERLSSAGESASRAAERLVRHLEESSSELEALVLRLGPVAGPPPADAAEEDERVDDVAPAPLRLLGPDDVSPGAARYTQREERP